ncbi:MAG: hypothetical protein GY867_01755, partial [bacterium]|nr:hypothetical protein [bacterium]
INDKATEAGVLLDMTLTQGHVVCTDLTVKIRDHEKEIEQSNTIYKKLQTLSPFVEETAPGFYYLDASGLGLLYKSDRQFAEKIIATVVPTGYPVKLGLAKNKFVARVASEVADQNEFIVISPGSENKFLKPLPISHTQLPDDFFGILHDLGLKTLGQLAAFPANEMTRRFGPQGAALSRLARGDDIGFFEPDVSSEPLSQTVWFTSPIYRQEMIIAHIEGLLAPLLEKLKQISQGCTTIEVALSLERSSNNDTPTQRSEIVSVERPTLSTAMFTRQLKVILEKLKLSSPVNGLKVTIPRVDDLCPEQLALDGQLALSGRNEVRIDIPGSHTVTRPVRHEAFLPEQRFSFSPPIEKIKNTPPFEPSPMPSLPFAMGAVSGLRLLQPPREVEIISEHNRPAGIRRTNGNRRVTAIDSVGPWELSGGWWGRRFDRLYYEIQTANRRRYLLFLDRLSARWFLQGVFD